MRHINKQNIISTRYECHLSKLYIVEDCSSLKFEDISSFPATERHIYTYWLWNVQGSAIVLSPLAHAFLTKPSYWQSDFGLLLKSNLDQSELWHYSSSVRLCSISSVRNDQWRHWIAKNAATMQSSMLERVHLSTSTADYHTFYRHSNLFKLNFNSFYINRYSSCWTTIPSSSSSYSTIHLIQPVSCSTAH